MAGKKVSVMDSLTGANVADGDLLHIVDISEANNSDKNKSITIAELEERVLNTSLLVTSTFTPVIADATSGGNTGSATVAGYYSKIGDRVFVDIQLVNINLTALSAGAVYIRDLPFDSSDNPTAGFVLTGYYNRLSFSVYPVAVVPAGTAYMELREVAGTTSSDYSVVQKSAFNTSHYSDVVISGVYRTSE